MKELIKIIETLCDAITDTPDKCDACPYFNPDEMDSNGDFVCEVWRTLEKYEGEINHEQK